MNSYNVDITYICFETYENSVTSGAYDIVIKGSLRSWENQPGNAPVLLFRIPINRPCL
jgi:hypothetical protein